MNRSITDWRRACIESQMRAYARRDVPARPHWPRIIIVCIVATIIVVAIGLFLRP